MFCGTSSFHRDGDDRPPSSPKISKKISQRNKNPYSSRGLDKFTSVLSDLEARREKIMSSSVGSQGISMIRFMYSNSHDWIPIIVRLRDDPKLSDHRPQNQISAALKKPDQIPSPLPVETPFPDQRPPDSSPWWKWRSNYCVPAMLILILLCLLLAGRMFAICCASIWWYSVPNLKGDYDRSKRKVKKKISMARSNRKMGSPMAITTGR